MGNKITEKQFKDFLDGDEQVFRQIIERESQRLFLHVNKFVKTKLDTEEIVQDILLDTWDNRYKLGAVRDLYGYIYSRANYKSLDFLKKHIPATVDVDEYIGKVSELTPDVESQYEAEELDLYISILVERMPEQRRKVFLMSRRDGLTRSEIAEKLNISPFTVSRHLSDAMDGLKKMLIVVAILNTLIK